MNCPHCDHPKVIVDRLAPINGSYYDEDGIEHPRLRCESCQKPIVMQEIQPSRPPKGKAFQNETG